MDDDRAVRDVVLLGLEQLGYTVTAVDSGEAAIAACQSGVPFDLVLLDMVLPNVTGDKVFSEIRSIHPYMKILVMSGFSRAARVEELLNAGRSVFLQKPFTMEELGARVRECLDGD
jgi:DNA-binding response OmpR family regulator